MLSSRVVLVALSCAAWLLPACGDDSSPGSTSQPGSAGSAGSPGGAGQAGGGSGQGGQGAGAGGAGAAGAAGMEAGGKSGGAGASGDQTPPTGAAALDAWLASGAYKSWHCEAAPHKSRSPSAHSVNRICSNDLIAQNAAGSGEWPEGAAAVKELFVAETDPSPSGYAVYLKTRPDSAGGANWYWFERLPGGSLVADGMGDGGSAKGICVGCHTSAGSGPSTTPSPGARDQVFTPVP